MDGSLASYLRHAIENSPNVRAATEAWRSATYAARAEGRTPEPLVTASYFLRSVETRVGPQRYKVGVSQTIPWTSSLREAKADKGEKAAALALVADAHVLALRREVAARYWRLWLIAEEQRLLSEHDIVLESLAASVRGRLQTGAATLADLSQVELTIARHHDHREAHAESAIGVSAQLVASLGAERGPRILLASDAPKAGLPESAEESLLLAAREHPWIGREAHLAKSEVHRAKGLARKRYPQLTVGASLIGVGEAPMAGLADSGKDAVLVTAGISVPLWGGYSEEEQAARATSAAHAAREHAAKREAEGEVRAALASLRNSQRRLDLQAKTLIPQAETTFKAVLGGYQVKSSTVAAVLLAQRDLIELLLENAQTRAKHATTLARLEYLVGSPLELGGRDVE